jgi:hypothetical protein
VCLINSLNIIKKFLLGDFNAKVGREDIFKSTIRMECLHEISNDNGVKVVNFAYLKISVKTTVSTQQHS